MVSAMIKKRSDVAGSDRVAMQNACQERSLGKHVSEI